MKLPILYPSRGEDDSLEVSRLFYEEAGSLLYLTVDLSNVLADDADGKELDATEKHNTDK